MRIGPKLVLPLGEEIKRFSRRESVKIGAADLIDDGMFLGC